MKYQCQHCEGFLDEDFVMSGVCPHCKRIIDLTTVKWIKDPPEKKHRRKNRWAEYQCPHCSNVFAPRNEERFFMELTSTDCPLCGEHFQLDESTEVV